MNALLVTKPLAGMVLLQPRFTAAGAIVPLDQVGDEAPNRLSIAGDLDQVFGLGQLFPELGHLDGIKT